ncbi:MAG: hypothetical protein K8R23_04675 [Chthoniobacter sp.]|nr:hypothetical protein [Chthoniobacter sp.]
MRGLGEFFRVVVVSFEFLFCLAIASLAFFLPDWLSFVGDELKAQPDVTKWIPLIPLALCTLAFQLAWKLTTPIDKSNKSSREVLDWPDYWRLKMRRNASLVLSFMSATLAVVLWVFAKHFTSLWFGVLTIGCFGVSLINAGCMYMATLRLREIADN